MALDITFLQEQEYTTTDTTFELDPNDGVSLKTQVVYYSGTEKPTIRIKDNENVSVVGSDDFNASGLTIYYFFLASSGEIVMNSFETANIEIDTSQPGVLFDEQFDAGLGNWTTQQGSQISVTTLGGKLVFTDQSTSSSASITYVKTTGNFEFDSSQTNVEVEFTINRTGQDTHPFAFMIRGVNQVNDKIFVVHDSDAFNGLMFKTADDNITIGEVETGEDPNGTWKIRMENGVADLFKYDGQNWNLVHSLAYIHETYMIQIHRNQTSGAGATTEVDYVKVTQI